MCRNMSAKKHIKRKKKEKNGMNEWNEWNHKKIIPQRNILSQQNKSIKHINVWCIHNSMSSEHLYVHTMYIYELWYTDLYCTIVHTNVDTFEWEQRFLIRFRIRLFFFSLWIFLSAQNEWKTDVIGMCVVRCGLRQRENTIKWRLRFFFL